MRRKHSGVDLAAQHQAGAGAIHKPFKRPDFLMNSAFVAGQGHHLAHSLHAFADAGHGGSDAAHAIAAERGNKLRFADPQLLRQIPLAAVRIGADSGADLLRRQIAIGIRRHCFPRFAGCPADSWQAFAPANGRPLQNAFQAWCVITTGGRKLGSCLAGPPFCSNSSGGPTAQDPAKNADPRQDRHRR